MKVWIGFLVFLGALNLGAQDFSVVDTLLNRGQIIQAQGLLKEQLEMAQDKGHRAGILWRLARSQQLLGDSREKQGAGQGELLALFEQGIGYGEQAITLASDMSRGYFWKAVLLGRWGQTKGVLESLGKAEEMRHYLQMAIELEPGYGAPYRVMGQLYFEVPGWPMSFGDKEKAIGYYRRSLSLSEGDAYERVAVRLKLAQALVERNANSRSRLAQQGRKKNEGEKAKTEWEKAAYWEGQADLGNLNDREEAKKLLEEASALNELLHPQERDEDFDEVLAELLKKT